MTYRAYLWKAGGAMGIYSLMVVLTSLWIPSLENGWFKTLVALTPMAPALIAAVLIVRHIRQSDEMMLRIQLESISLSFVLTAVITLSYGFLETAGFPRLSMFMVWPLMGALWMICGLFAGRRYR